MNQKFTKLIISEIRLQNEFYQNIYARRFGNFSFRTHYWWVNDPLMAFEIKPNQSFIENS